MLAVTLFIAAGAPNAWALLVPARRVTRGSNRILSEATLGQLKLVASDAAAGDKFGYSVAIDGDTLVVGAYAMDSDNGSVYVFRTSDGGATYGQVAKLTASDAAGDKFGYSVAIDGATIVVGAPNGEAAYVFLTTDGGATYGQVAKLTSADAAARYDSFGYSVAIAGDTVVSGSFIGAAFVFSPLAPAVPQPTPAALESDSATRAGTLATVLGVVAATALAL